MNWEDLFKRFNKEGELMNSEVTPEDEKVYRDNIRNTVVNKLGLPEDWRSSLADEKRFIQEAPMAMAMGSMGAVKGLGATKVVPTLEQTLAQRGLGKVLTGAGQEMKNIAPKAIQEAAAPELAALRSQKPTMAPGAYDAQKQAIFNKVRKMLGGE